MYSVTEQFVAWLAAQGYRAATYPPADETVFVTVERTGGGVEDMVDHPALAIQAWATTEPRAEEMCNEVRVALLTSALPVGVMHVEIESGPYRFYDDETMAPRYQLTVNATSILTD